LNERVAIWELTANTTLSEGDFFVIHWINCSTAADITLPTAAEGVWIEFFNYGTQTITVRNPSATSIGTLANWGVRLKAYPNASGVPAWPAALTEEGSYVAFTSTPA
jgi:hypothetical protein